MDPQNQNRKFEFCYNPTNDSLLSRQQPGICQIFQRENRLQTSGIKMKRGNSSSLFIWDEGRNVGKISSVSEAIPPAFLL